jgi:hypothetical protein
LLTATATATLVTMLTGPALAAPAPTPSAPSSPAPATGSATKSGAARSAAAAAVSGAAAAQAEDDGLPTEPEDKVRAAREIGIEPGNDWLGQSDRNFVFLIWQNSASYPLIRTAAELALSTHSSTIDAVCKEFILKGIFDAKVADDAKKISDENAARQARDLKRAAYAAAGVAVDTEGRMLVLSERDVIIEIWEKATGPRVKEAAGGLINGTAEAQHEFLATGVNAAAEQDLQDRIREAEEQGAAEQARLAREGAMKAAAAILGIVADPGKLAMTDDNFIRWIWETVDTDPRRSEISDAAESALRSSDPAVWRAFIDTGMREADKRDQLRLMKEREEADRAAVQSIRTKAAADGFDNLVSAALQALTGDAQVVSDFVRSNQYKVAPDAANRPASGKAWQWVNPTSGKCIGAEGDSVTVGKALVQLNCADSDKQRWIAMRVYNTGGAYRLVNAWDRTKCAGVVELSTTGSKFTLRACDSGPAQRFYYTKQGENFVWISEQTNQAITVQNPGANLITPIIASAVNNSLAQQFFATSTQLLAGQELSEAKVLLSHLGHSTRIQSDGNVVISKGPKAVWSTSTTTGIRFVNQRDGNLVVYRADGGAIWSSSTYGQGPSTLKMQKDGNLVLYRNDNNKVTWSSGPWDHPVVSQLHSKCINVTGGSFQDGVQLEMLTCNNGPAQQFMFKDSFISFNGKCMDVKGSGTANGSIIQLWTCNNTNAQVFHYYSDGTIRNPNSGKCIDINNSNRNDGVKLAIWTCGTGVNQKWK